MKNVKFLVESWEMLEDEAAVNAENDNFDAVDGIQPHAYVQKRKLVSIKKKLSLPLNIE